MTLVCNAIEHFLFARSRTLEKREPHRSPLQFGFGGRADGQRAADARARPEV
jgi:hypothetical protein